MKESTERRGEGTNSLGQETEGQEGSVLLLGETGVDVVLYVPNLL